MNVVIDEYLKTIYLEDSSSLFFDNGHIWTVNLQAPRLQNIIDHVKESRDLLDGKYFGKSPFVRKVKNSVLDAYRTDLKKKQEVRDEIDFDISNTSDVKDRLWFIMQESIKRGASDVHIEVLKSSTRLLCRVDGVRVQIGDEIPDPNYGRSIFSVIFLDVAIDKLSDFSEAATNAGRIEVPLLVKGKLRNTIWRASYMPAKDHGGKVSLRWLNKNDSIPELEDLGYTDGQLAQFYKFIRRSKGVFLLSGVTNSGKTTLISSLIKKSKEQYSGRSHHTLEDPPEFDLGVVQTHVQPHQKVAEDLDEYKDYGYYTKVLLRQDPDFISIGEIRDHNVAMETCRLGDTGQLVVATLHTSSAIGIGETLISQYKVEPAILATPDLMVIWATQTLVSTLCPHCKVSHNEVKEYYQSLNLESEYNRGMEIFSLNKVDEDLKDVYWKNPKGCSECNNGQKGLTSLLEMIVFDNDDLKYLSNQDYLGWHKSLISKGYKELKDHAILKIKYGMLDVNTAADRVPTLIPQESHSVYLKMLN
ncbi:hypothetical protein ABT56_18840 [Photobacterium aquae]|uniref:Bacterial type II secretion system protein E domain-containing protein n=1 Tax=Photobacterium aquae TaxID=1195763 RepID=A0A0J1GVM0_9GAMM|nr:ATPase, T2SS/T4P/T4SS family [Photobacterium aquae]KLV03494.1 hypothetical protein ABT56_18840 [Photobacterium aquae]